MPREHNSANIYTMVVGWQVLLMFTYYCWSLFKLAFSGVTAG